MKKCPSCGTVLDDSKTKCYMCGAELNPSSTMKFGEFFDSQVGATVTKNQDNVFNNGEDIKVKSKDVINKKENGDAAFFSADTKIKGFYSEEINKLNSLDFNGSDPSSVKSNSFFPGKDDVLSDKDFYEENKKLKKVVKERKDAEKAASKKENSLKFNEIEIEKENKIEKIKNRGAGSKNDNFKSSNQPEVLDGFENHSSPINFKPNKKEENFFDSNVFNNNKNSNNNNNKFENNNNNGFNNAFGNNNNNNSNNKPQDMFNKKAPEKKNSFFSAEDLPASNQPKNNMFNAKKEETPKPRINWGDNLSKKNTSNKRIEGLNINFSLIFNSLCFVAFIGILIFAYVKFLKPTSNENQTLGGLTYTISNDFKLTKEANGYRYYSYGESCNVKISFGAMNVTDDYIDSYLEGIKNQYLKDESVIPIFEKITVGNREWSGLKIIDNLQEGITPTPKYRYISVSNDGNYYHIVYANTTQDMKCTTMFDSLIETLIIE